MSKKRFGTGFRKSSIVSMYKQQSLLRAILVMLLLVAVLVLSVFLIIRQSRLSAKTDEINQFWENGMYEDVCRLAALEMEKKPMDFALLTLYGFSSYQAALAQINNADTQLYVDQCIWALRKALLLRGGEKDARIAYVLGKAYFAKGPYYAELAVAYLEKARNMRYAASDLAEYLGLSYAAIEDYRSSVASFSMSLSPNTDSGDSALSDLMLLTIAQSYIGLNEHESARAYLIQCIESSKDEKVVLQAHFLLGKTFLALGDTDEAVSQYEMINEISGGNADAHFELGEIYSAAGDTVRARAEWRNAVRVNPSHLPARERLQ